VSLAGDRTGERGRKPGNLGERSGDAMPKHNHTFVEKYEGMVAFGFSREVDEKSLMVYLQKISDDDLVKRLVPRLSDEEIDQCFGMLSDLLRKHLSDAEYHEYFLKDGEEAPE
jgi:hypothetical protein